MSNEKNELKSSGNEEFDRLAAMAVQAGFRVFPRTPQIVAADGGSSGAAEQALANFERIVREQAEEALLDKLCPALTGIAKEPIADAVSLRQMLGRLVRKTADAADETTA